MVPVPDTAAVTLPGAVRAAERWTLGFGVDGVVSEIGVRPGDRIAVGEWVASLDTAPLDRAVNDARDRLRLAKLRRSSLDGTVWTDNGNATQPMVAESEADQLRTDIGVVDASVAASAAILRRAVSRREAAELRSPVAGRVAAVRIRQGESVDAGTEAIVVENDERFEVVVRVPAAASIVVRAGSTAEATWVDRGVRHRAGLRVLAVASIAAADGGGVEAILAFSEQLAGRPPSGIAVRMVRVSDRHAVANPCRGCSPDAASARAPAWFDTAAGRLIYSVYGLEQV